MLLHERTKLRLVLKNKKVVVKVVRVQKIDIKFFIEMRRMAKGPIRTTLLIKKMSTVSLLITQRMVIQLELVMRKGTPLLPETIESEMADLWVVVD